MHDRGRCRQPSLVGLTCAWAVEHAGVVADMGLWLRHRPQEYTRAGECGQRVERARVTAQRCSKIHAAAPCRGAQVHIRRELAATMYVV